MKEYKNGDLVRYTSLYKKPIAEICEVRETSYLIRFMNGNFAKATSQEIKPIPLTPEILEKNGWKRISDEHVVSELEYFDTKLTRVNLFYSIRNTYRYDKYEMIYVHQLQHLLFGLGLSTEMEVYV